MHLSEHVLQGALCPINAGLGLLGIATAAVAAAKNSQNPQIARVVGLTALIFAGQMLHLPVLTGSFGLVWLLAGRLQQKPSRNQFCHGRN